MYLVDTNIWLEVLLEQEKKVRLIVRLTPEDIKRIIEIEKEFDLDFDDSYQYVAAERFDHEVMSFDSDFDKTEKGRTTPEEILEAKHQKGE